MVQSVKWNTGAPEITQEMIDTNVPYFPALGLYNQERGTIIGKICTSGIYCNDTVERTTTWTGSVGLIYPSDYVYASTDASCRINMDDI